MKNIDSTKIAEAIRNTELLTSGEIRVYIAKHCKEDALDKASRVFQKLKMHNTAQRNAVLILVCPADHKAAILGDKGINSIIEDDFWDNTLSELITYCSKDLITEGICKAVDKVGNLIKQTYPYQEGDINELDNEVILED
ncbi:MAG TPA: TPM domain-containing protein [Dysgonamonadaceae bacterium]|nr:TPM domain-containing protein [Dysgonamonadaceae bacterium]